MTNEAAPAAPKPSTIPARPRAFSGIQPSGIMHLGNDLGAVRNYVALQERGAAEGFETIYCIVDYHALTSVHDPDRLRRFDMRPRLAGDRRRLEAAHTAAVQAVRGQSDRFAWLSYRGRL